jgi:hypothetical protein
MKTTKRITRLNSWLQYLHDQVRLSNSSRQDIESSILLMYEIQNRINIFKKLHQ